jgi:hypothetical protein
VASADRFIRPYLVHPKLIEQPTWGGQYIVTSKGWGDNQSLMNVKIGQSYELFSGSNLSLAASTDDASFTYELTDRDAVARATAPSNSVSLADLIANQPDKVLGPGKTKVNLLIKYTQALGNSFQVHMKSGASHPTFKPKPESWYYFEPGLITLGVRPDIDWAEYETVCREVESAMKQIGARVASGSFAYDEAVTEVNSLLKAQDPWRFVNTVPVAKDELVDLSAGGIHHSWEEDAARAPRGNILYELQAEALDNISTFRSFDKGKLGQDGEIRSLQIDEYFTAIDRSDVANDPTGHMRTAQAVTTGDGYSLGRLMKSGYYNLDKLDMIHEKARYTEENSSYRHLFVKAGRVEVTAGTTTVTVGTCHSCFIPAGALRYHVTSLAANTQILVSH